MRESFRAGGRMAGRPVGRASAARVWTWVGGSLVVLSAAPQMTGGLDVAQGGTQGALAVREQFGEGLHRHVRTVGEPVDERGDGRLAGRQVREIGCCTGQLAGCRTLAVAGAGHRVRCRRRHVRGARGGTKLSVSHGGRSFGRSRSCWSGPRRCLAHRRGLICCWGLARVLLGSCLGLLWSALVSLWPVTAWCAPRVRPLPHSDGRRDRRCDGHCGGRMGQWARRYGREGCFSRYVHRR